jgi:hypothetical protein
MLKKTISWVKNSLFFFEKQAFPSPRMTTNNEWVQNHFVSNISWVSASRVSR